jgi:2-oxo-4-hydroxy-4-carboxy-5-ureidoimidazoline decarboxylase
MTRRRLTMAEVNRLDRDAFVARFGGVFEHSPWVAEAAWEERPFASVDALLDAMLRAVREAPEERRMALIREHPDLGARFAMSEESAREQQGAGLDRLTEAEFAELSALNRTYAERFGFPFILAVRGKTKEDVLDALRARVGRSAEEERREALRQIGRIAAFRLADLVAEDAGAEAGAARTIAAAGETAEGVPGASAAGTADGPGGKPSGRLTTHVLDLTRGRPAAGMRIELFRLDGGPGSRERLCDVRTNADGRTDGPLLAGGALRAGVYELVFHAGDYFRAAAADKGFLDEVPVRFRIADPSAHYHVPLLAAPGGYSTYRGS